jgi:hypothetical protein
MPTRHFATSTFFFSHAQLTAMPSVLPVVTFSHAQLTAVVIAMCVSHGL